MVDAAEMEGIRIETQDGRRGTSGLVGTSRDSVS